MQEKTILVYYINVGNMSSEEVSEFLQNISTGLIETEKENNILSYLVPIKDTETRIECINPRLLTEEEYLEAKNALKNCKRKMNEFVESLLESKNDFSSESTQE